MVHIGVASNHMETFLKKSIQDGAENIICLERLLPFLALTLSYWWDIKLVIRMWLPLQSSLDSNTSVISASPKTIWFRRKSICKKIESRINVIEPPPTESILYLSCWCCDPCDEHDIPPPWWIFVLAFKFVSWKMATSGFSLSRVWHISTFCVFQHWMFCW